MTRTILIAINVALLFCFTAGVRSQSSGKSDCESANQLTAKEKAEGWKLLFDGKTLNGWHGYNGQKTDSWTVENCTMKSKGTDKNYGSDLRADLTTDQQYENFEISIDWKASKGGNSGIIYGVVEDPKYKAAWMTGPEYQFIDDVGFPQKLEDWQMAGANYAMHLPNDRKQLKPVGEWNNTRIVVNGKHVEHWLNGKKILEFERWTDEWNKLRDSGKWKEAPDYGKFKKGRIVLQDHGSIFWFRNIKIKELPPSAS